MIHANAWRAALLSLLLGSAWAAIAQTPPVPGGDAKPPAADAKTAPGWLKSAPADAKAPDAKAAPADANAADAKSPPAEAKATDAKPAPGNAEATSGLTQLAWLEGCWRGSVNQREFREHWLPLRGNLLVGASQTVMNDKTLDFEYMRIEPRTDGVYYVTAAQQKETAYRLAGVENSEGDVIFTFANAALEFPQKIVYRRSATEGWLYATVEGKVKGADRRVIYPMRRINCESGEVVRK